MHNIIVSYKTIYRIDYPLSFRLVDHLGKFSQIIYSATTNKPYSDANTNISSAQHLVMTTAKYENDEFKFNLTSKTLGVVIEHKNGADISTLNKHPTLELADDILNNFDEETLKKILRIGFRTWVIVTGEKLTFEEIKKALISSNSSLNNSLSKQFNKSEDICLTFESKNTNEDQCRINLGPYRELEASKYFSLPIDVKEGFIMDIDVWQNNCEIPKLSLANSSRHYFNVINQTANAMYATMKEMLNA